MEGNIITWDDGWDYLEKGIIKMKRRLKGLPEPPFNPGEYRIINTVVQKMCTQMPPHDYSQRLYDEYRKVFEEYMIKTVLRSLEKKHDESLLRELKRKWQNNKEMVIVLSRFFHFLNRYFIARRSLPALNEVGLTCFRDLVYEEVKANARDAVINLIDEEREGQQIDRTLLKDVIDIYVKIGMGQMECYEHDFEADMLRDSGDYYSRKASNWIVDESYNDYISKTGECLQRERDRVTHYLHRSSEQKLVEKVQHELLVVYATHLLSDDKVEDLSLMYKYYHEILLYPVSTIFKQHVTAKGIALVQQAENAASSEAANGVGVQIRVLIRKITELHQKYMEYVNDCFLNHSLFHKALKEAFEVICNKTDAGSPSAELLATLCNVILKKGGSEKLGDEAIEETLRKYSEETKQKFKKLRRNGGC